MFRLAFALVLVAGSAMAECMPYEPTRVTLSGVVQRGVAFGPPGYGETPKIDAKEVFYSIRVDNPVCTVSGDQDNPAEASVKLVEMAFSHAPSKSLPGEHVRVVGTLFHAFDGHHHTAVLITPDKIDVE
jgi:hypothetical protein